MSSFSGNFAISSVNAFSAVLLILYGMETVGGILPEDEISKDPLSEETLMTMLDGDLRSSGRKSCIVIATDVTFVSYTALNAER